MTFLEDVKPLVAGPTLRFLSVWIELVTFSLALLSGDFLIAIVGFSLAGIVLIFDLTIALRRKNHRKINRLLDQPYIFKPAVWSIVLDFVFGLAFLTLYVLRLVEDFNGSDYHFSVFGAHVLIGFLVIAHMHIFLGSVELHLLRQVKNGQVAARRAQGKKNRDNNVVELPEVVVGPDRV